MQNFVELWVYLSATPGSYELQQVHDDVVEQVIRPTGLLDPEIILKPTKGQIDDLIAEIRLREERNERGERQEYEPRNARPDRRPPGGGGAGGGNARGSAASRGSGARRDGPRRRLDSGFPGNEDLDG